MKGVWGEKLTISSREMVQGVKTNIDSSIHAILKVDVCV